MPWMKLERLRSFAAVAAHNATKSATEEDGEDGSTTIGIGGEPVEHIAHGSNCIDSVHNRQSTQQQVAAKAGRTYLRWPPGRPPPPWAQRRRST